MLTKLRKASTLAGRATHVRPVAAVTPKKTEAGFALAVLEHVNVRVLREVRAGEPC